MNLRSSKFFITLTYNIGKYNAIYLSKCYQKFPKSFEILDFSKIVDFLTEGKQL